MTATLFPILISFTSASAKRSEDMEQHHYHRMEPQRYQRQPHTNQLQHNHQRLKWRQDEHHHHGAKEQ